MSWWWLLVFVPLVFSGGFLAGAAWCYRGAYQDGHADGVAGVERP